MRFSPTVVFALPPHGGRAPCDPRTHPRLRITAFFIAAVRLAAMLSPFRRNVKKHKVLYIIYFFYHNNKCLTHFFFCRPFFSLCLTAFGEKGKKFAANRISRQKITARSTARNACKIRVMHSFHSFIHSIMSTVLLAEFIKFYPFRPVRRHGARRAAVLTNSALCPIDSRGQTHAKTGYSAQRGDPFGSPRSLPGMRNKKTDRPAGAGRSVCAIAANRDRFPTVPRRSLFLSAGICPAVRAAPPDARRGMYSRSSESRQA